MSHVKLSIGVVMLLGAAGACESPMTPADQVTEVSAALVTTAQQTDTHFSDGNGWTAPQYYKTLRFPDLNGDKRSDVCGRGSLGITCALDDGSPTFANDSVWSSAFSDANGWNAPQYYSTIAFPDVNGDGYADVCGRGGGGIYCALSNGASGFGPTTLWSASFSDANGWNAVQYYSTIAFPDVDGDGYADVCGRGSGGIWCALSNRSSGFATATIWNSSFSDANGWNNPQYYSTIAFPDLDGIHGADVCGRGSGGISCAKSNGTTAFTGLSLWNAGFSDAAGWNAPQYYSTLGYPIMNIGTPNAPNLVRSVCGRGNQGLVCASSTGSAFVGNTPGSSVTIAGPAFSDPNGWSVAKYYATIRYPLFSSTGLFGVCGRGAAGVYCSQRNGSLIFVNGLDPIPRLNLVSGSETDANGWDRPEYYGTITVTSDGKLCDRGIAGIRCMAIPGPGPLVTPPMAPSNLSVTSSDASNLYFSFKDNNTTQTFGNGTVYVSEVINGMDIKRTNITINTNQLGGTISKSVPLAYLSAKATACIKLNIINSAGTSMFSNPSCGSGAPPPSPTLPLVTLGNGVLVTSPDLSDMSFYGNPYRIWFQVCNMGTAVSAPLAVVLNETQAGTVIKSWTFSISGGLAVGQCVAEDSDVVSTTGAVNFDVLINGVWFGGTSMTF